MFSLLFFSYEPYVGWRSGGTEPIPSIWMISLDFLIIWHDSIPFWFDIFSSHFSTSLSDNGKDLIWKNDQRMQTDRVWLHRVAIAYWTNGHIQVITHWPPSQISCWKAILQRSRLRTSLFRRCHNSKRQASAKLCQTRMNSRRGWEGNLDGDDREDERSQLVDKQAIGGVDDGQCSAGERPKHRHKRFAWGYIVA